MVRSVDRGVAHDAGWLQVPEAIEGDDVEEEQHWNDEAGDEDEGKTCHEGGVGGGVEDLDGAGGGGGSETYGGDEVEDAECVPDPDQRVAAAAGDEPGEGQGCDADEDVSPAGAGCEGSGEAS